MTKKQKKWLKDFLLRRAEMAFTSYDDSFLCIDYDSRAGMGVNKLFHKIYKPLLKSIYDPRTRSIWFNVFSTSQKNNNHRVYALLLMREMVDDL